VIVPLPVLLPVPLVGALDGEDRPVELLEELLPELPELPELLPELALPPDVPEVAPDVPEVPLALELPLADVPEFDPVEPADEPVAVLAAEAWWEPGRITATTPAASTLAADTETVAAVSRRRPCSRAATARATRRAAAGPFPLFMSTVWHPSLDPLSGKLLTLF
jgi:hypothetical protein